MTDNTDNADTLISIVEAAKMVGLHKATIRREILRGSLPGYKMGTGQRSKIMIYKYDFMEWIEKRRVQPVADAYAPLGDNEW